MATAYGVIKSLDDFLLVMAFIVVAMYGNGYDLCYKEQLWVWGKGAGGVRVRERTRARGEVFFSKMGVYYYHCDRVKE